MIVATKRDRDFFLAYEGEGFPDIAANGSRLYQSDTGLWYIYHNGWFLFRSAYGPPA